MCVSILFFDIGFLRRKSASLSGFESMCEERCLLPNARTVRTGVHFAVVDRYVGYNVLTVNTYSLCPIDWLTLGHW